MNAIKVSKIDWRRSYFVYPFIVINILLPIEYQKYQLLCKDLNGSTLQILPDLDFYIDEMLDVLAGCLLPTSNFREVLEEYYGEDARKLKEVQCDFNGIKVVINDQMTAKEAKLNWLRDGLKAGYKNMAVCLSREDEVILER